MANKLSIVIADDEPITRMDLRELLTAAGCKVAAEAGDGLAAVEACRKHRPSVVLLDIKMPVMDGLSAAKMIEQEDLADAIILLTAYRDKELIDEGKTAGISGYLVKPIDAKSLIPNIEIMAARGREVRKLRREMLKTNERLTNRTIIDRAKGRIMTDLDKTEDEAYTYIRELSLERHLSMKEISEIILRNKKI